MFGDDWSYKDPWAFKNIRNVDYRFVTIHAGMAKNYPEMKRLDLRWLKSNPRIKKKEKKNKCALEYFIQGNKKE